MTPNPTLSSAFVRVPREVRLLVEAVERSTSRPSTEDSRRTGELLALFFSHVLLPPMRTFDR
jgi:hypothetical protein